MQHSATPAFNKETSQHKLPTLPLPTAAAEQPEPTHALTTTSPQNPLPLVLLWLLGRWWDLALPLLLLPLLLPCT